MEFQISPPEPFLVKKPEQWNRWIRRFECYRIPSGLNSEDDKTQANMLLYLLVETVDYILTSFGLSEEELKSTIPLNLNSITKHRTNVIYESDF